jgi:hypothetical protein
MQGSDAIQLTPVEPGPIIPPILRQTTDYSAKTYDTNENYRNRLIPS